FGLSYPDLQIRFGLMSRQEVWNYIESTPMGVTAVREAVKDETKTRRKRQKLSELKPRSDAPPL
ncbi:MAG: XRE family transcriptional regulator, partial [Mycolicibacterium hassiacum]